ncbi:PH domain-containing protein [Thermodesulfobacteriota bacterium]
MSTNVVFRAPWGRSLKITTTIVVGILIVIPIIGFLIKLPQTLLLHKPAVGIIVLYCMILIPVTILFGAALFMIRGYVITKDKLFIQRLGWNTIIDLNQLQTVEINPDAINKSTQTFGNGGLFSVTGKFQSEQLGSYIAYVTNPDLAVILKFTNKVIVVTPENPNIFAEQIKSAMVTG